MAKSGTNASAMLPKVRHFRQIMNFGSPADSMRWRNEVAQHAIVELAAAR